jgi:biotin carboxylase
VSANMPAVVIVDPILSGAPYCTAVRAMGLRLIGVISLPDAFFNERLRKPDPKHFDRLFCETDCARIVRQLAIAGETVVAVIAGAEAGVTLADRLGHALGVTHNDMALLSARRNKFDMKVAARLAGLGCAIASKCYTEADLEDFVAKNGYPVVLKTPSGTSTSQVFKCGDWRTLRQAFAAIVNRANLFHEIADYALIEEHIDGDEYVVDLFADASGVHVTDMWRYVKIAGPNGDTLYYDTIQIANDEPALAALRDYAIRLTRAVGIRIGPAHAEIKLTPRGPVMIEIGARPAGGQIPALLQRVSNFNLYKATLEAHIEGRANMEWPVSLAGRAWLVDEAVPQSGRIRAIHGLQAITALPSYVSHHLNVAVNDDVEASDSLHNMALLVCLAHEDPETVRRDARHVHDAFSLDIARGSAAA